MAKNKKTDTFNNPFGKLKGLSVSGERPEPPAKETRPPEPPPEPEPVDDDAAFAQAMGALGVKPSEPEDVLERPLPGPGASAGAPPTSSQPTAGRGQHDRRRARKAAQRLGRPEATLDLHGVSGAEVAQKVEWFLENARFHGCKTVLIVTGKGAHSGAGPVLRPLVEAYLAAGGGRFVEEWIAAPKDLGGSGALLVALRAHD